jgi:hypothetical protein
MRGPLNPRETLIHEETDMSSRITSRVIAAAVITTLAVTGITACSSTPETQTTEAEAEAREVRVDAATAAYRGRRQGRDGGASSTSTSSSVVSETTTAPAAAEIEGLVWMREEEKLAHDVYLTMFDMWGAPIFERIAASEQRHTDAVSRLIEGFGLDDPVADDSIGVFTNPELQDLYDDLVEQGSGSLVDAMAVGALIEELDIDDLRRWLSETDNAAIERVYENLLGGSESHLRAFVRQLTAEGGEFEPVHLSPDDAEEILAGQSGTRPGRTGRGRGPRSERNDTRS